MGLKAAVIVWSVMNIIVCDPEPHNGSLVMIGGNLAEDNEDIWSSMVELAGGEGVARVGVVTAANADPAYWGQYYVDMFLRYGAAEAVYIPVTFDDPESAFSEDNVAMVDNVTGVFLGGGDPWRLAATLMQTVNSVR